MATYYWTGAVNGGTGTWDNASNANWSLTSGGAGGAGIPGVSDIVYFNASSGSGTVTIGTGATCNIFVGLGYTGTFAFSSNTITITGNANTIFYGDTTYSVTGSAVVDLTFAGSSSTRTINPKTPTQTNSFSFNVKSGSDTISITSGGYVNSLDFTGFSGTFGNTTKDLYGDLTISTGMTVAAGAGNIYFIGTGTKKVTTNNKLIDCPIGVYTIGGTVQLQDNLTMGSTRTFTLNNGTLNLNNQTLSTGLFASSSSSVRSIAFGTGNITVTGSGTVWTTSTTTNFSYTGTPAVNISNNSATATTVTTGALSESQALNFNYTVGSYALTDTSSVYKNLNFTGFTGTVPNSARTIYGNLTIVSGATNSAGSNATTFAATSGTQQITTNNVTLDYPLTFNGIGGTFAFQDALTQGSTRATTLTNGTLQLKAGATATVGSFATSGTNQKYLQSTSAGSQATLSDSSGTNSLSYTTIKDINATGGATWNAYLTSNNINAGNNAGFDWYYEPGEYMYTRRKTKRLLIQ